MLVKKIKIFNYKRDAHLPLTIEIIGEILLKRGAVSEKQLNEETI